MLNSLLGRRNNIYVTLLHCNCAVTTGKKKFTINYKHWLAIWNFETTKIRNLDISSNNKILPKLWFPKILINCNPGHNILELCNILVQIRFTTSKMKLDIKYSKLSIQVVSQVSKQLTIYDLRKLENIRKISNFGGHIA